jgi:hypothetical protein
MSVKECFIVLAFPMDMCYRFSGIAEDRRGESRILNLVRRTSEW